MNFEYKCVVSVWNLDWVEMYGWLTTEFDNDSYQHEFISSQSIGFRFKYESDYAWFMVKYGDYDFVSLS